MKAVVFKGVGNIVFTIVDDPVIEDPKDVIVNITRSAICGTDLHLVRGTVPDMKRGTILGHEAVGVVAEVGTDVHNFRKGDRVIIPSTIGCGICEYCRRRLYAQCDIANPEGPDAGTAYFGGPRESGSFSGLQAEKVRVPFADAVLVKIPDSVSDDEAILLSDILPTAYMGVEFAQIEPHDTVAVFGCGPVGQLVIACLKRQGVQHIFAIDRVSSRLAMAKEQGAYVINFDTTDPVKELKRITQGKGPTKVIDAVGVDAEKPASNGISKSVEFFKKLFKRPSFTITVKDIAPDTNPHDGNWQPGNGPSQVVDWAVQAIAKAGTLSIIGVYPATMRYFPLGDAMGKNLTIRIGDCNHRKYIPELLEWVQSGFSLLPFITQKLPLEKIIEGYKKFDKRDENWIKVVLIVNQKTK